MSDASPDHELFDDLTAANRAYVEGGAHRSVPVVPSRHLAVVTCMDARIDVFAVLGLELGEAHVVRNAGARVTDDVLRSLTLSAHLLETRSVILIGHTACGALDPEGTTPGRLTESLGRPPEPREWGTFTDSHEVLRRDAERLLQWPDRPTGLTVGAYLFDVVTGQLEQVVAPTAADRA